MCGIAGIYCLESDRQTLEPKEIKNLISPISHRGLDGKGIYNDKRIGLGHRRLSIIDLEFGNQPMLSKDGNFIIVFNGEVYNYLEIKQTLKKKGHIFITNSDTEVVLKSYIEWGANCVSYFNGMWALAIYDKNKNKLFCSRDRMGIKPFYYTSYMGKFIFASELKAFYNIKKFKITLEKQVLWDHFVFGPKSGGETYLKGVFELSPGMNITIDKNKIKEEEYFNLSETFENQSERVNLDEIEELLISAINLRLRTDVPLATINSGGIDSSLISAIAKNSINKLKTYSTAPFTLKNKTLPGDESFYAELLSKHIQSDHKTIRYSKEDFFSSLEESIRTNDGELYHSNSVLMNRLFCQIKKDGVSVVLGGEGADEIFGGYYSNRLLHLCRMTGNFIGDKVIFSKYSSKKFIKKISTDTKRVIPFLRSNYLSPEKANHFLDIKGEIHPDRSNLIKTMNKMSPGNALSYYEQRIYLSGLLRRADRMSMANQVELRVPFLDHRLVIKLNSIKYNLKSGITQTSEKKILKVIAKNYLPIDIIKRKKYGFGSPLSTYRENLINRLDHTLLNGENINNFSVDELWLLNSILDNNFTEKLNK